MKDLYKNTSFCSDWSSNMGFMGKSNFWLVEYNRNPVWNCKFYWFV